MNKQTYILRRKIKQHIHYSYLNLAKGCIGMLMNLANTSNVFDIKDGLRRSESTLEMLKFTVQDPEVISMIQERYLRPVPNTEKLRMLPLGTLDKAYVEHIDAYGFYPHYFRQIEVKDDIDYIMMRLRQTHDIWHIVTGFDPNPLGEIALKAVELSQTHRPKAAVICAGAVLGYLLKQPQEFGDCFGAIAAGYSLGLRARLLLAVKWEEMWDRQLNELRSTLNIVPNANSCCQA